MTQGFGLEVCCLRFPDGSLEIVLGFLENREKRNGWQLSLLACFE